MKRFGRTLLNIFKGVGRAASSPLGRQLIQEGLEEADKGGGMQAITGRLLVGAMKAVIQAEDVIEGKGKGEERAAVAALLVASNGTLKRFSEDVKQAAGKDLTPEQQAEVGDVMNEAAHKIAVIIGAVNLGE